MEKLQRTLLFITGIALLAIGANVGFGGILTLGFQAPPNFVSITDAPAFAVQDSHVRYLGGFFFMAGLVFITGSFFIEAMRSILITLCTMIAGAGLFRFFGGSATLLSLDLIPSLIAEFIYAPALAIWLWRSQ